MKYFVSRTLTTLTLVGVALFGVGKAAFPDDQESGRVVKLEKLKWSQFQKRLTNPKVKYTIVDAWSTTCPPCMENFPHVVEMHRKYAPKGLAIISLSLDDTDDKNAVAKAEQFLKDKKAVFTNVLLDEASGEGFDKLNINGIPAVFIYGPDGKEVKRFTMDDPDNQFTYDEVEKFIVHLLGSQA
jgi:thiol-disulfide isomerase/thioredoxin